MNSSHSPSSPFVIESRFGCYSVEFLEFFSSPQNNHNAFDTALLERIFATATHAIVDANVAHLYPPLVHPLSKRMPVHEFTATESNKSWDGASKILRFLAKSGAHRKSHVLVVGGGITQDTASFACHIFHRGLEWSFLPTTLLAMADSCIGGKCAINIDSIKNLAGAFHPPQKVIIEPYFLSTLQAHDVVSGYGELLKMHLLVGESAFIAYQESLQTRGFSVESHFILPLIQTALLKKKEIVESDELEAHTRKLLNYGHTFGHALETLTQFAVPHGLAVAWGIGLANFLAAKRGWTTNSWEEKIHEFIRSHFFIPKHVAMPQATALVEVAAKDKKLSANGVELVVMNSPGLFLTRNLPLDKQTASDVQEFLEVP